MNENSRSQTLDGKVALVTGATSGMGEAVAVAMAAAGASIVLTGRREEEGARVAASITDDGGRATFVAADITVHDQVASVVEAALVRHGRLDIAFNNAGGVSQFGLLADQSPAGFAAEIELNLSSVFFSMRHEIPAMLAGGGGVIINNASQLGLVGIGAGVGPYVAAKHGVIGLTKAAALEYADQGLRVNAIAPAGVDTPLYRSTMGATPEGAAHIRSLHPVGRIATAQEIASFVVYLAGDDASFFTGAAIPIDGGWTAQ